MLVLQPRRASAAAMLVRARLLRRCLATAPLSWIGSCWAKISAHSNKRVGALSYASFALETIDDGFLQPAGTPRVQISPLGAMQADFELAYAASSILPPLGRFGVRASSPIAARVHRSTVKAAPAAGVGLEKEQSSSKLKKLQCIERGQRRVLGSCAGQLVHALTPCKLLASRRDRRHWREQLAAWQCLRARRRLRRGYTTRRQRASS